MSEALRGPAAASCRPAALRLAAAFAAGAVLNLAFAPFDLWPLALLAPAVLFRLIRGEPPRRAAWAGAAFGVGLFAVGTAWLYTCLHVFGLVPVWLTLLLQSALVALLAAYPAAFGYLANRFWGQPGASRDWLALPGLWMLLEWLRGWLFTGFPWLSLGYALIDSPLKGWAPLLGVYGVTWAAVLAASALAVLATPVSRQRRLAAAAVLLAVTFVPALPPLAGHAWTTPVGAPLPVAAVQGAVPQDQKWQYDNRDATLTRYMNLTLRAWGARLIIWPESALPVLAPEVTGYLEDLEQLSRLHGADVVLGLVNYLPETQQYFNGILVLGTGGGWYYKRHLVPFGEYFPVPSWVRSWMRLMSLPYDDISAGPARQPVLRAAGQPLGLTICYEDAFGSSDLAVLRQATLLINVTNNAWFGDSTAPHQHLQIARMRALEAGRFMIQATNDGITAAIGPHGEVQARLPQFQQAVLRATVQPLSGLTPYARVGNVPVVAGALALGALAVWRRRATSRPAPRPAN